MGVGLGVCMPTLTPPHRKYELDYDLIPRLFIVLLTTATRHGALSPDHAICLEFLESLYIRYLGSLCFLLVKVIT